MSWENYYKKIEQKPPRPLLLEALRIFESRKFVLNNSDLIDKNNSALQAIDFGSGAGRETLYLLEQKWKVFAVEKEISGIESLKKSIPPSLVANCEIITSPFEELAVLPPANLFFASFSIPFCKPKSFDTLWIVIDNAILTKGVFAGNFFGSEDDWVKHKGLTGKTYEEIKQLFKNYEIVFLDEKIEIGPTALGSNKNWHIITVIAVKK